MAEQQKVTRTKTFIVQAVGSKETARGPCAVLTAPPGPGQSYPESHNIFDLEMAKEVQVGDTVTLNQERGNIKKTGTTPQYESDYWWNTVGLKMVARKGDTPFRTLAAHSPPGKAEELSPSKLPNGDPWHRWIAWAGVVEQARLMVENTLAQEGLVGNTPAREGQVKPGYQALYAERFMWAMEFICARIREEMGK